MQKHAGKTQATVAMGFVTGMLAGLARRGIDPTPLLAEIGVDIADAANRIPVERYAALYNRINRELDDEGFGLFAQPMRCGSFEFLCRSTLSAPTLDIALQRCCRFLHIVLPDLTVSVHRRPDTAKLCIRETRPLAEQADAPGRVFAFEWLLRLLHGLACWLAGRGLALDSVAFPYPPPPHAADYALIFTEQSRFCIKEKGEEGRGKGNNPVRPELVEGQFGGIQGLRQAQSERHGLNQPLFGSDCLIATFNANLLDLPIRRDEAALDAFLDGAPGKITTLYRRDREMVIRVRDLLRAALPASLSLDAIAERIYLSPRTLHRRLEEEGSSFRAIKDALRRDTALARLAKTADSIAEIAADLGYADPSAFYRAFVAWTGMAPLHYRQRLANAHETG